MPPLFFTVFSLVSLFFFSSIFLTFSVAFPCGFTTFSDVTVETTFSPLVFGNFAPFLMSFGFGGLCRLRMPVRIYFSCDSAHSFDFFHELTSAMISTDRASTSLDSSVRSDVSRSSTFEKSSQTLSITESIISSRESSDVFFLIAIF